MKVNDPANPDQADRITEAYKDCWNVDAPQNANWRTAVHSADNLAVLREADMHLYDLSSESYGNDEQVTAQLHVFEDSALNPGLAEFDWLDKEFGSTEIEDTMPMFLKIVEKELVAGATIAEFVAAFTLQQTQIVAAYTARGADGRPMLNEKLLLDHLWGVLTYSRLPDAIHRSLKSQLLAWTSAQFSMAAVLKGAGRGAQERLQVSLG